MLSEQEAKEIKQNIIGQIESTFPVGQIASARQQIESMDVEQLEEFLEKNNLIKETDSEENNNCIFCSIVSEKIKSLKIGENENSIAVLEINPISRGHTIIIPRNHQGDLPKEALTLAEEISTKLKKKLKPKEVKTSKSKLFGHEIISILPVYEKEDFNSEKKKADIQELEKIKEEIEKKPAKKERKPRTKKIKESVWLPKRIP
jgi:histidine triad (HIT) family protein